MPAATLTVTRQTTSGAVQKGKSHSGVEATTDGESADFTIAADAISFAPEVGDRVKVMGDGNPTRTITAVSGGGDAPYVVTAPIPS
ncbi:MAG: hypothetical protein C0467_31310 [Planctomycetaceae bacterium]|nr:hypothetical protein [Planctomycetaceae bacterium]